MLCTPSPARRKRQATGALLIVLSQMWFQQSVRVQHVETTSSPAHVLWWLQLTRQQYPRSTQHDARRRQHCGNAMRNIASVDTTAQPKRRLQQRICHTLKLHGGHLSYTSVHRLRCKLQRSQSAALLWSSRHAALEPCMLLSDLVPAHNQASKPHTGQARAEAQ